MPASTSTSPGARSGRRGGSTADRSDPVDKARDLLAQVRIEGNAGRYRAAVQLARRALRLLPDDRADAELTALLLINLGSFLSILGRTDAAVDALDEAMRVSPEHRAPALSARALVYSDIGDLPQALASYDQALIDRTGLDPGFVCTTLIRRGATNIAVGRIVAATADFTEAAALARAGDLPVLVYMADHNLGWVRYLRGDLPGALAAIQDALLVEADKPMGYPALDHARILMSAGLLRESGEFVDRAVGEFESQKAPSELVDGMLVRSELHLLTDEPEEAVRDAERAVALSRRRRLGNRTLLARLARLRAREALRSNGSASISRTIGGRSEAGEAREVAEGLQEQGLLEDAAQTYLLEADGYLARGRIAHAEQAAQQAEQVTQRPTLPVTLHRRLVAGRVALARQDRTHGLAELRKGLDELADFQARFGSQDMQAGASIHGSQLAKLGLRTAVDTGSPALILQWLERARAVSTRLPAVNPPADAELAELLGALRYVATEARQAAVAGKPDEDLRRKAAELRRQVRARSWVVSGSGAAARPITLSAVQRLLATDPTDPTIVAYITGRSAVHALVITARAATYQALGSWDDDATEHRRRAADLDMLAAPRIPTPIRDVAVASIRRELSALSDLLITPIRARLSGGPIIVAATGELAIVPWALMPALTGRPVSVSASVTAAMASGGRPARAHLRGVLAVAGPDVPNGEKEARQVAAIHPGAGLLTDDEAIGEAVLAQLPDGGLLHVAAHGHHEPESPLFSSVLLADGPLYGYDIAPNAALPDQVVLSSCDVGRSDVRPGGEPLGLAAALLRSGVSTVIAGVSKISDATAAAVMHAYHERLVAGDGPAAALAGAVAGVDDIAPFACFGSGT